MTETNEALDQLAAILAILDTMGDAVIWLDGELRVQAVSAGAERLLGVAAGCVRGRPCAEVLRVSGEPGTATCDLAGLVEQCVQQRGPVCIDEAWLELPAYGSHMESPPRRSPVCFAVGLVPWDGHCAGGAMMIFRDMSRRPGEDLRSSIISMVSHELRTPLTHIKGFASTLLQPEAHFTNEEKLACIRAIDGAADRLAKVVSEALQLSRLTGGAVPMKTRRAVPSPLFNTGLPGAEARPAGWRPAPVPLVATVMSTKGACARGVLYAAGREFVFGAGQRPLPEICGPVLRGLLPHVRARRNREDDQIATIRCSCSGNILTFELRSGRSGPGA